MKGIMTITAEEGKEVNFRGSIMLKSETEKFEIISCMAKCLGINDTDAWARCVVHCLGRMSDLEGLERTEIIIPAKGENDGRG